MHPFRTLEDCYRFLVEEWALAYALTYFTKEIDFDQWTRSLAEGEEWKHGMDPAHDAPLTEKIFTPGDKIEIGQPTPLWSKPHAKTALRRMVFETFPKHGIDTTGAVRESVLAELREKIFMHNGLWDDSITTVTELVLSRDGSDYVYPDER